MGWLAVVFIVSLQEWLFPKFRSVKSKNLCRIFDERRLSAKEPDKVKASRAELLGVYGLLRHYVECELPADRAAEPPVQSFFAACKVLDWLLAASFEPTTSSRLGSG
jgi:hypothetical protein